MPTKVELQETVEALQRQIDDWKTMHGELQIKNDELRRLVPDLEKERDALREEAEERAELITKLREQVRRAKAENAGPLEDALRERTRERDEWKALAKARESNPLAHKLAGDYDDLRQHLREIHDSLDLVAETIGTQRAVARKPGVFRRMLGGLLPGPKDGGGP